MTLEDLIYERLIKSRELPPLLAKFGKAPAVFFQNAPDDKATGWKGRKQYPRIDYVVDLQHNPERKTSGTLTLNIWSAEDGTPPEEIEPLVRQLLCGIFLVPDNSHPYALTWARSEPFESTGKYEGGIIVGATLTFDVFAFPAQVTTDPDPILAINHYIKEHAPEAIVIGADELERETVPTADKPAFYFRLETIQTERETNTVAWVDAVLAGHIFAAGEEVTWIKSLFDVLALDGEVTMMDDSPMFIRNLKADTTLNATSAGQVRISVHFGLLRRKPLTHILNHANMGIEGGT